LYHSTLQLLHNHSGESKVKATDDNDRRILAATLQATPAIPCMTDAETAASDEAACIINSCRHAFYIYRHQQKEEEEWPSPLGLLLLASLR